MFFGVNDLVLNIEALNVLIPSRWVKILLDHLTYTSRLWDFDYKKTMRYEIWNIY